jgi:imidazolonepropionase-like amidohydrolase
MLFQGFRVFDGDRVRPRADVLVEDGRIVAVGTGLRGTPVVRGATLLPGLIDAHVHLTPGSSRQAITFGVTTQLDMFAEPAVVRAERAAGPNAADLRSAGIGATAPGGHPAQYGRFGDFPTVSGVDGAAAFVADRLREGSDYLKVFATSAPGDPDLPALDADTVAALVAVAHGRGVLAVAHATDQDAARRAVEAGVDGLAHLPFDRVPSAGFVAALARARAFVIPTLTAVESFVQVRTGFAEDPLVRRRLGPDALANLADVMGPPPPARYRVGHATAAIRPLRDAGVPLLAGTDAGAPGTAHGASLHRELALLVAAGLTPVEALACATSTPARCFNLADRGRIAPGLRADLVVVDGDPTTTIEETLAVERVYRGGKRVDLPR